MSDPARPRLIPPQLADADAFLAAVVSSSTVAIISKRLDGTVVSWNSGAEQLYGYTEAEMCGRPITDIFPREKEPEYGEIMSAISRGERVDALETRRVRADGTHVDVLLAVSPVFAPDGSVVGASAVTIDITPRKRAERKLADALRSEKERRARAEKAWRSERQLADELEHRVAERTAQLQAANDELKSFAYSVAHDLRAPLRAIAGFTHILVEDHGPELPDEPRRMLDIVANNVAKMEQLIDDLLALSRLSRKTLQDEWIDPCAIVDDVLADLTPALKDRQVEVTVDDLPPLKGDQTLIRQLYLNLIDNALKYTRDCEPARIEVGAQLGDNEVTYYVRDNGVGFDMAYADKLFGVFQRLHSAADYEGTGVGLATVQRIVQRHGGRVWAEAAVDEGATFYFTVADTAAAVDENTTDAEQAEATK